MLVEKFLEQKTTADGSERASVPFVELSTLWLNSGTRCNLACENCYIESSPTNDRLSYLTLDDVVPYLDEIRDLNLPTKRIGITGGEPFINPSLISIFEAVLERGLSLLVLTNAYRVLDRHLPEIMRLSDLYGDKLSLRVSLDHYTLEEHEKERGKETFHRTLQAIGRLEESGINWSVAGRSLVNENVDQARQGYEELLKNYGIHQTMIFGENLVVFPEMDLERDVPEITTKCWGILGIEPTSMMCATERMIVKRKGEEAPVVLPCTLLAYDRKFEMGKKLEDAQSEVFLNHKFCAQFCVLGGASCSSTS